ncbi:MFS transporter [Puniceicoccales bacterium CK1056]|uniref:MFS transporter n=1 Tax=Oceanipulchritudo coccoides TaxID=2706888 RepID=A0A6B2M2W5_9BACT|nr:MFS transporter [Oceanipulchritudo coccoides]NDV62746.1 MFS transporter [Oceanipulchritudo coccoides]
MGISKTPWDPRIPFDPAKFPVFYGWVIVAASTIGIIASIPGQTMGVSVYTDTYIEALGLDRVQMTTAYLVGTGLSGFLVSTGGVLFDKLGARKFFVVSVMLFGVALAYMSQMDRIISLFGMTGSTVFALAVASLGFTGIRFFGQGMVTLGSRSMLSKWWNLRRGRMVAISGCFVAFGFSLAPRVLDWQIQLFGWRGSLLVNGGLLFFGLSALAWVFFRDNPEECGLEMDNGWRPEKRHENPDTLLLKEFTRGEAMKTYSFWIITISLSFHGLFTTAYTFHVIDLARSFKVPRETILNFFIYSSFLSVTANFVVGYITDRIRLRFVITVFCLGGFVFCGSLLMLPTQIGMIVLVIGMGISWGIFPILSTVGYARYFGRAHIGAINGASMAWLVWGSAVGPLFFSLSKDYMGGYEAAIYGSMAIYLLLAIGSVFSQNPSKQAQA